MSVQDVLPYLIVFILSLLILAWENGAMSGEAKKEGWKDE